MYNYDYDVDKYYYQEQQSSLYNSKFFDILKILKFNKVKQRIGRDLPIWIVNLIGLIFVIIVIKFVSLQTMSELFVD